jgi:hypothetical protein
MHHAILVHGSYPEALTLLPSECHSQGSDVIHYTGDRMGIDEARTVIEAAYKTPLSGTHRYFILAFPLYTLEAQNALLKILEEPPETARFYVLTKRSGDLLPTLRSRLMPLNRSEHEDTGDGWDAFKTLSYRERLEAIGAHATKKDDAWMEEIMQGLEAYTHTHEKRELMHALVELRPMFSAPGASRKMILEHLALMLPPGE